MSPYPIERLLTQAGRVHEPLSKRVNGVSRLFDALGNAQEAPRRPTSLTTCDPSKENPRGGMASLSKIADPRSPHDAPNLDNQPLSTLVDETVLAVRKDEGAMPIQDCKVGGGDMSPASARPKGFKKFHPTPALNPNCGQIAEGPGKSGTRGVSVSGTYCGAAARAMRAVLAGRSADLGTVRYPLIAGRSHGCRELQCQQCTYSTWCRERLEPPLYFRGTDGGQQKGLILFFASCDSTLGAVVFPLLRLWLERQTTGPSLNPVCVAVLNVRREPCNPWTYTIPLDPNSPSALRA
ncbi:hypothetical protein QBC37DRAFT_481530 [Rhypophila decipiens]|uniref:Uncharacterized protein n=1 Tax=Rhypophila decipiens TaxID=261697 RepID=A0AAN7B769_9PEZI|nr:hypothetical protein QBC37DRAFT_481530 [Rhypophila decipiens]